MKPLMKYRVTLQLPDRTVDTWGILPILTTTKILDGIFNPENKELSILLDSTTEQYINLPFCKPNGKVVEEVRKMDKYYSLKLQEEDVNFILENLVENNFEFETKLIITDGITG